MTRIETTYRITTPMFCSGAEQDRAELRLPSFKGILRFWWRALAAEDLTDLAKLRTREATIFGSAGQEGQSKLLMRSSQAGGSVSTEQQAHFAQGTWEAYVGYGITDNRTRRTRDYVPPGTAWTIEVLAPRLTSDEYESVRRALILVGLLGGLGARSRKGWGSLTLETLVEDPAPSQAWKRPRTREALRMLLQELIPAAGGETPLPLWTALTPHARAAVGPVRTDAASAHRFLAERYREAVRSAPSKDQREGFGLPRVNAGRNAKERRASPVFLHVHQLEGGEAIPIAAALPAVFLPAQARPSGSWDHVYRFLASIEVA